MLNSIFQHLYKLIFTKQKEERLIKNFILSRFTKFKYLELKKKVINIQKWIRKYLIDSELKFVNKLRKKIKRDSKLLCETSFPNPNI